MHPGGCLIAQNLFAAGTLLACAAALAQTPVAIEKVAFNVKNAFERGAAVSGELRIPGGNRSRLPAVLILHGSAGIDGRGVSYAEPLNEVGIATFEIDMFQGRGRPMSTRHNMPHAFESLEFLSSHPRIDGARVGIMGFSWGGVMSLFSSSEEIAREFGRGAHKFAAHLAFYPVCYTHSAALAGRNKFYGAGTYRRVTGSPVHILAGDKDGYDDPDGCERFVAALPGEVRRHFSVTVYSGATHGWDGRAGGAFYDMFASNGNGGTVDVVADAEIARRSRQFTVEFFRKHLGAD